MRTPVLAATAIAVLLAAPAGAQVIQFPRAPARWATPVGRVVRVRLQAPGARGAPVLPSWVVLSPPSTSSPTSIGPATRESVARRPWFSEPAPPSPAETAREARALQALASGCGGRCSTIGATFSVAAPTGTTYTSTTRECPACGGYATATAGGPARVAVVGPGGSAFNPGGVRAAARVPPPEELAASIATVGSRTMVRAKIRRPGADAPR